ncbi:MAG TPA: hypothetical protein VFY29_10855 [Terriglobia bacterium]|nr:hypothetical protein [Terriglobia bacterium]
MIIRLLIALHRWLGVALCVLFFVWFASGIGMMYWGMPSVTAGDRLDRAPALDPSRIRLSPQEAAEGAGIEWSPAELRLNSYDGRPVYRFGGAGRGSANDGEERGVAEAQIVYADTGEQQGIADRVLRDRVAAAWSRDPVSAATVEAMGDSPDQWTVGSNLRDLRPLWKYSWPDGQQLYIGESGEVLQYTTTASRLAAYVSAIPHWVYFTSLRQRQPVWIRLTTYSAMAGTGVAVIGVVLGLWMYSPFARKYRHAGAPSSVPYRGQKRWHTILGLVFGAATITWVFSGSLAFLPFPQDRRSQNVQTVRPAPNRGSAPTGRTEPDRGADSGERAQGSGRQRNQRERRNGGTVASALRGKTPWKEYRTVDPREFLAEHPEVKVRELAFTSFKGQPLYTARLENGESRLFSLEGAPVNGFATGEIIDIVKGTAPNPDAVETRMIDEYDVYYLDRTRRRPLPVILALMRDSEETRYYIDPATATVVGNYRNANWTRRWLYQGLHSLNFPWLYNHRPLWDIVVIGFMLGGSALSVTSLVLAWRAAGKRLRLWLRRQFGDRPLITRLKNS